MSVTCSQSVFAPTCWIGVRLVPGVSAAISYLQVIIFHELWTEKNCQVFVVCDMLPLSDDDSSSFLENLFVAPFRIHSVQLPGVVVMHSNPQNMN